MSNQGRRDGSGVLGALRHQGPSLLTCMASARVGEEVTLPVSMHGILIKVGFGSYNKGQRYFDCIASSRTGKITIDPVPWQGKGIFFIEF